MSAASDIRAVSARPRLVEAGADRLSRMERFQISAIGRTFTDPAADRLIRFFQRHVGSTWITVFTDRLRQVHGFERLPPLDPKQSFICVCNHRSFFDLYVVTGHLVKGGMPHRLVFPVRSEFFYDSALGLFVNGVMSFFAMYPPVFRDRRRAALNVLGLDEIVWLLGRGGTFVGIHPEGTRNKGDDPYTLLPVQSGVGRLIHRSRALVLPVFINGLINDLPRQIQSNFDGTGIPIHIVFGQPLDFASERARPGSPRLYRDIATSARDAITALGQEEKRWRQSNSTSKAT